MPDLNVLIVHKDVAECRNMLRLVDWNQLHMKVAGCVSNGDTAAKLIGQKKIDILLCDICAARSDGTEQEPLFERLAQENPQLLLIAISGPDALERLLLAMRLENVYDYVQTPINFKNLEKVLLSASRYWSDFNTSVALNRLSDLDNFDVTAARKRNIRNTIRSVLNDVRDADISSVAQGVSILFQENLNPPDRSDISLAQAVALELLSHIKYLLLDMNLESGTEFSLFSFIHKIRSAQSIDDLEDLCLYYLRRCIQVIAPNGENNQMSALVRTAIRITKQHYADSSFTLVSLSDEIGISPNYLSSVFKMETGMRFKKFLNSYRVEKAKGFLADSRYKIYEVSDLVGIEDSRYFSQIFRTYTGMKPSEYRNSCLTTK